MVFITRSLNRIKPLFDRVLVKKVEPVTKTKSGVLLPEKANKPVSAVVVEVGSGLRGKDGNFLPICVKVGDEVIIPEFGGTKIEIDEQEHHMFKESELLGKVEK